LDKATGQMAQAAPQRYQPRPPSAAPGGRGGRGGRSGRRLQQRGAAPRSTTHHHVPPGPQPRARELTSESSDCMQDTQISCCEIAVPASGRPLASQSVPLEDVAAPDLPTAAHELAPLVAERPAPCEIAPALAPQPLAARLSTSSSPGLSASFGASTAELSPAAAAPECVGHGTHAHAAREPLCESLPTENQREANTQQIPSVQATECSLMLELGIPQTSSELIPAAVAPECSLLLELGVPQDSEPPASAQLDCSVLLAQLGVPR